MKSSVTVLFIQLSASRCIQLLTAAPKAPEDRAHVPGTSNNAQATTLCHKSTDSFESALCVVSLRVSSVLYQAFLVSEGFSKERDHIVEMIQVLDLQGTDKVISKHRDSWAGRQRHRQADR